MEDIDKTFQKLKKRSYRNLQKELLSVNDHLFSIDNNNPSIENIVFPKGAIEIIEKNGWTKEEFVNFVAKISKYTNF